MSSSRLPSWQHTSGTLTSPLPPSAAEPAQVDGVVWRLVTRISPALRASQQQKRLADDLLWLGLLLGLAALWCFNANLHAGHGVNLLIVTLAGLSALLLGGGVALDRRAVRSGWRRPR